MEDRGPLWVDGQFTVRLRGLGAEPGRIIRLRRPFALIGQIPGADIRIDDPAVDGRHALLLLDRRGVFGVDLLSQTGTRFAGTEAASSWLGAGDILEIAGRRIELLQLRVDGSPIDPPLSDDDPLGDAPGLIGLTLEPLDSPGPPWMLGSALAFVGRGEACAIRVENASASLTHCALLRCPSTAYVIDLLGRSTLVNERAVEGASILREGDVLGIGRSRFAVKLDSAEGSQNASNPVVTSTALARLANAPGHDPRGALVALLVEAAGSQGGASNREILDALRRFQTDAATLLEAQIDRIEAMNREINALREEVRGQMGPPPIPAEPLRMDLIAQTPSPTSEPSGWLLDRLQTLETENRSTWKDLLGKIASTVATKPPPSPGRSLAPTRPNPPLDAPC